MVANNNNMAMSIHKKREIFNSYVTLLSFDTRYSKLNRFYLILFSCFFYILPQAQRYYFIFIYANTEHEVLK